MKQQSLNCLCLNQLQHQNIFSLVSFSLYINTSLIIIITLQHWQRHFFIRILLLILLYIYLTNILNAGLLFVNKSTFIYVNYLNTSSTTVLESQFDHKSSDYRINCMKFVFHIYPFTCSFRNSFRSEWIATKNQRCFFCCCFFG